MLKHTQELGYPPFAPMILGLADGAYGGCPFLIIPYRKDHKWTGEEGDYNAVHSWYRARVEHLFGILWNFAII